MTETEADIQLGFPYDEELSSTDDCDVYMDKIGGRPIFFSETTFPPQEWARCKSCSNPLLLVTQMWAKLPKCRDRVFYVLGCNRKDCIKVGSWRVIKSTKSDESRTPKKGKRRRKPNGPSSPATSGKGQNDSPNSLEHAFGAMSLASDSKKVIQEETKSTPCTKSSDSNAPHFADFGSPSLMDAKTQNKQEDSSLKSAGSSGSGNMNFSSDIQSLLQARNQQLSVAAAKGKGSPQKGSGPARTKQGSSLAKPDPALADQVPSLTSGQSKFPNTPTKSNTDSNIRIEPLAERREAWCAASSFPAYLLEFASAATQTDNYEHEMGLLAAYKEFDVNMTDIGAGGADGATWAGEQYEKAEPGHFSKHFKRFQRTVEQAPEQCIRYSHNGQPVFYASDEIADELQSGPPPCERCQGPRSFEFQLMPMILAVLPTEQYAMDALAKINSECTKSEGSKKSIIADHSNGMEWGTILIYTCKQDCEDVNYRDVVGNTVVSYSEEYIAVQIET
ncbi:programmed cell death protein 2 [Phlyctochytrium arcticum]|nr:programmed cell death protein 2 [Phlyctochytrium arcticum]